MKYCMIKHFDKNPKCDGYQQGLALMVYTFFDKKSSVSVIKNENISNKELGEEVQERIITFFKKK